jgi:hypothetical protein
MGLFQDVFESSDGGAYINLRDGAGTNLTSTLVSGKQALDVNVANSIAVGTADKSTFTYGTSTFLPVGGVFQDTSPTLTAGQSGAFRLTANRGVHVNLRDPSGNALGDANADGLWVRPGDGTNTASYSATGEQFISIRQGGNLANVNGSNQLLTFDGNSGSILALMKPTTGTLTQPAGSSSSSTLLASNASRKGWSVQNATNKVLYIATSATATTAAYTVSIQANSFYESMDSRVYTGVLSMISPSGVSGNAIVTEYT